MHKWKLKERQRSLHKERHKKQLKLWAVQLCGGPRPWDKARDEASEKFFKSTVDSSGVDAYTGRVK